MYGEISLRTYVVIYQARLFRYTGYSDRCFYFYQIYRLVKGTVAINIFAGIFTFYVAWLLVRALNMELITSIMGQFFGMGMIALLIVFQQEVRRFLLLVGSKYNLQNIFNLEKLFAKPVIKEDVSDAIVEACVNFSASKTGALIVFQQNTELYNYAQTGVMMKAKVTDELIENIFSRIRLYTMEPLSSMKIRF